MTVGFDFGTTNSLISVVVGDRVLDLVDAVGLPHPSVVRYEGQRTVVGREARQALEEVGSGIHGNTVRSPKMLLGDDLANVGGVDMSPVDIVADVVKHVRTESMKSGRRPPEEQLDRAVVTIPVTMNGLKRAALRDACSRAGISLTQFVHEPLAALYGYLRGEEGEERIRALMRRYALVVDWGGGTLDLTLCRLEPGRILQLKNGGNDRVGGDQFDKTIQEAVVTRFMVENGIEEGDRPDHDARLRLRQDAEQNKIVLSERPEVSFYRPGYFARSGTTLEYRLSRSELDEITRPLVSVGIDAVEALLEVAGISPAQVSRCIVTGGMAAMPAIRSRLHEMFGPERVDVPANSATLVSQGAAWIAHDQQRLVLAKQLELDLARGSRLTILPAGTPMPSDGTVCRDSFHLFCADPSDGRAKFPIVTPSDLLEEPQASSPRTELGLVTVAVDRAAKPLFERLTLDVEIDDDLILAVRASSSQAGDSQEQRFHDLEFGIGLPGSDAPDLAYVVETEHFAPASGLVVRANVAQTQAQDTIPGEVLYAFQSYSFSPPPMPNRATQLQIDERAYYQPCSVCQKAWGQCRCDMVA